METILAVLVATSKPGYFLLHPIAPEMKTTQSKRLMSDNAQRQYEGGTAGNRKQMKSTRRSVAADPNGVPNGRQMLQIYWTRSRAQPPQDCPVLWAGCLRAPHGSAPA